MLRTAVATSLLAGCGGEGKSAKTTTSAATETTTAIDTTVAPERPEAETEVEARDDAAFGDLIVVSYAQVGAESD